jgi:nitroimidazol reductase NimA-like FMN-containing flavoprotein (pyridoxamine 5'-phosphate oxidase superfamily)
MRVIAIQQEDCVDLLNRISVGRLACALDNQPYVVPVSFAYEPDCLYVFSTLGQKIEWMRQNPKVCLQADEYGNRSHWTSVVVTGKYLELADPQYTAARERAKEKLGQNSQWWATPMAERREQTSDPSIVPIFFRIDIESMSGLRGIPEAP